MTAHAESPAEAELPPLTNGPHRQRIGVISVVAFPRVDGAVP